MLQVPAYFPQLMAPARAAAVALLAVVLGLVAVMVASVIWSTRLAQPRLVAANLGAWEQAPIPVRAPLPLSEAAGLWLLRADVKLAKARVRAPTRALPEPIEGPFAVPLHWVEQITLAGARVWFNVGRNPRGTWTAPDTAAIYHLLEPLQRLAFDRLVLRGAHLTTTRPSGAEQIIDQLDADISATPGGGVTAAGGRFHYRGEAVKFEADLKPVAWLAGRWSLPTRLTATSRLLKVSFDGLIQLDRDGLRLDGHLDLKSPDAVLLSRWLGLPLPDGIESGPLTLRGEATWRDGLLAFESVHVELDGQIAHGGLTVSIKSERPFIDGALAFAVLDARKLGRWLGWAEGDPRLLSSPALHASSDRAEMTRIPLFSRLDADLRLSAGQLTGLPLVVNRLAASVTARSGSIAVDFVDVDVAGGTTSGQINIDQSGSPVGYRLRLASNHLDAGAVCAVLDANLRPFVEGRATLRLDLTGRGRSWGDVLRSLDGEASILFSSGGRASVDLAQLMVEARERKSFPFLSHVRRETSFERIDARIAIRRGSLLTDHAALVRDGLRINADGAVHTATGRIFMRLLSEHGFGLAKTARMGRSQSVLLHGNLANPTVMLEEPIGGLAPAAASVPSASQQLSK